MSPPPLGAVALAGIALRLLASDGLGLRVVVLGVGHFESRDVAAGLAERGR